MKDMSKYIYKHTYLYTIQNLIVVKFINGKKKNMYIIGKNILT